MGEIEHLAKKYNEAMKEAGLGTPQQWQSFMKKYLMELIKEDEKKCLAAIEEAQFNAWLTECAIKMNDEKLVLMGEGLVVDFIADAFQIRKWSRYEATFTFDVVELDGPLIIEPKEP